LIQIPINSSSDQSRIDFSVGTTIITEFATFHTSDALHFTHPTLEFGVKESYAGRSPWVFFG
jgi:hypothetical protein